MAPKKRTSTGAVKTAFVSVKNVKDGQTVSVKGKVLRKSAIVSFGNIFSKILMFFGRGGLQKRPVHKEFSCVSWEALCKVLPSTVFLSNQGHPKLEIRGRG